MALSEYFSDDDIITQLRLQFEEDNMWDTDFRIFLNTAEEIGGDFYITVRGRSFVIDGVTGEVSEVTGMVVEDLDEEEEDIVEVVESETIDDNTGDDDNNNDNTDDTNDDNDDTGEDDDNTEDETE